MFGCGGRGGCGGGWDRILGNWCSGDSSRSFDFQHWQRAEGAGFVTVVASGATVDAPVGAGDHGGRQVMADGGRRVVTAPGTDGQTAEAGDGHSTCACGGGL